MKYRFIATGCSQAPSPRCIIRGERLSNEAMNPSELLRHLETKHSALEAQRYEDTANKVAYTVA